MSQDFENLLKELHETSPQPNPEYWHIIIINSKIVMREIDLTNQGIVAKKLGMTQSKLSNITAILKEYTYAA